MPTSRAYSWLENSELSLKGEVKNEKLDMCEMKEELEAAVALVHTRRNDRHGSQEED